jgi:hypothetical protein
MAENRVALIGLSVLGLTATITIALAQNTSNPLLSGNTTNPRLSGNTVAQPPPVPVSPAPNLTIPGLTIGKEFVYWSTLHWTGRVGDTRSAPFPARPPFPVRPRYLKLEVQL